MRGAIELPSFGASSGTLARRDLQMTGNSAMTINPFPQAVKYRPTTWARCWVERKNGGPAVAIRGLFATPRSIRPLSVRICLVWAGGSSCPGPQTV